MLPVDDCSLGSNYIRPVGLMTTLYITISGSDVGKFPVPSRSLPVPKTLFPIGQVHYGKSRPCGQSRGLNSSYFLVLKKNCGLSFVL